jgi:hypothetical protein
VAKIEFKKLGDQAREADEKAARSWARKHGPGPDLSAEACIDCGVFGGWGDGKYFYCDEHVPHDLRHAAASFHKLQE